LAAETYETGAELVVRVELPDDVEVDVEGAAVGVQDGTLEIRLPRRDEPRAAAKSGLVGFHPDAPPS
jgi:HSP20 family molecular chaperone IbpA